MVGSAHYTSPETVQACSIFVSGDPVVLVESEKTGESMCPFLSPDASVKLSPGFTGAVFSFESNRLQQCLQSG